MAEKDDLEDILDSALNDFRLHDGEKSAEMRSTEESSTSSDSQEKTSLGKGLGLGLPALGSREKRAGPKKSIANAKTSSSSKVDEKASNAASMTDTLEELAQKTRQTLEEMDMSDQNEAVDKLVESLAKQFEELGSSEDMQSIMDVILRPLLSKEVLHEPMMEFREKYPKWLEVNKAALSVEDFDRYSRQYGYIKELCEVYDTTPDDFPRIVDIVQNMQTCGQPPNDLVEDLAPGMDLGGDNFAFLADILKGSDQNVGHGPSQNCNMM
ncbi:hypothetical protein KP509_05G002000 [Ceratopteris richardii]|uniref:Uncharacterized protein n=1 Tax=Ceratopteris richardii TaxID=49495 RepID=A0A8T2UKY6_CERRI|nr:hypothetical protein KP509_05G002000 [Ceratopteris richardii]